MTVLADLTPARQAEMIMLVKSLRESVWGSQEALLKTDPSLQEDDAALRWLLDNMNDSWKLSPRAIYGYIRTWAPRIVFIDYFPFSANMPELHDGTRYVVLASLWSAWVDNGDRTDGAEVAILKEVEEKYLIPQGKRLLQRGEIHYDALRTVPDLPVRDVELRIYNYLDVGGFLRGFAQDDSRGSIQIMRNAQVEHFLNHWLANLLSPTEYDSIHDMSTEVLRNLYPAIWNRGPHLMLRRHQERVTETIAYDMPQVMSYA